MHIDPKLSVVYGLKKLCNHASDWPDDESHSLLPVVGGEGEGERGGRETRREEVRGGGADREGGR